VTTLRNLTAHPVTIVGEGASIVLPACPSPPRITDQVVRDVPVIVDGLDIPVRDIVAGTVAGLPEPREGVLLVVPRIVAAARPERADLVVPFDDIRDSSGRVIGCRALARLVPLER
jgi:hypothetical protein